jgi:hypothetical protein
MEQGEAQKTTVKLKTDNSVVYDLLEHRKLEPIRKNNEISVTVDLKPGWGTILAIYPEELAKVEIHIPQNLIRGKTSKILLKVIGGNGKPAVGIQPLYLLITDPQGNINEYSGYYAAINGKAEIKIVPALNDCHGKWQIAVTELSSGIKSLAEFQF